MITKTLKLQNQLDLVIVVQYQLLELVRSRSLHNGERVAIVCWMTDVLYVPKLTNNLFSVNAAAAKGNTVYLDIRIAVSGTRTERSLVLGHP